MRKRNKVILGFLLFLLVVYTAGTFAIKQIEADLQELPSMAIKDVDISSIQTGTYYGAYAVFPIDVEVEVVIANAEIQAVHLLKHRNGQGENAETIPALVVENQSLHVDAITGATYSSKVILKAIELALTQN